ncbi:Lysophospholipase [Penicillium diatomitis]|uniref:Lysophospholipase n=1 Tax=Penicillium diatomitis TaxID=2819901 RepID=A0A9W9X1H9_9EURO|nr:Lysophospholipase [Penicillium diatomitis]KAJ5480729.1 Lysophospholipase [Penicillium diatomitis]
MKVNGWLVNVVLAFRGALAAPSFLTTEETAVALISRALPNAPDGYAPKNVSCPAVRPTVRTAETLSSNETSWLQTRRKKTLSAMKDFFGHVKVGDLDVVGYLDKHANNVSSLPNVGIAVSGGGYRALMNGAGAIKAFDSRTDNASTSGHLGGLLQSATYVAGLSGGSWLLGSIYINNFTTVSSLQTTEPGSVWQFGNSILKGPDTGGIQLLDSASYYKDLADAVQSKVDAQYNTSLTDVWGRALSYQMFNASNGGIDYTWSSIAHTKEFIDGDYPMPLVVADGRKPGQKVIGSNSTVFEFNPWEFGTWDPSIFGFAPLEYLGSSFEGGSLPSNVSCVRGFDNAGFIIGTSSSLFNQFILQLNTTSLPNVLKEVFAKILGHLEQADDDIAIYDPNPFYQYHKETSPYALEPVLDVVDGGEDGQNIPLHPLIQPNRHVDVIFAVDSSADTNNWPNGTSLVATYERSLNTTGIGNGTAFPAIPDQNTFVNLGLNTRPTFFGCNSSNTTGHTPLIVYIPNAPYSALSNVSTFDLSYNDTQRDEIILNGYEVATMANSTRDMNWTACVGCAILSRSFERTNTALPSICTQCFSNYCWNGTTNSTEPNSYYPDSFMNVKIADNAGATLLMPAVLPVVMAVSVIFFGLI